MTQSEAARELDDTIKRLGSKGYYVFPNFDRHRNFIGLIVESRHKVEQNPGQRLVPAGAMSGSVCRICGSMMQRDGSCERCTACGETAGGCSG